MGYTVDFEGQFVLDRTLTPEHAAYLRKFAETRRVRRDETKTEKRRDPIREAAGLPVGDHGGYFVGEEGLHGQGLIFTRDITKYNTPPDGQPGLWCHWVPTDEGDGIEWDQGEKFYEYEAWLRYLIHHFLIPWGYVLSGTVTWVGEDPSDLGRLVVMSNGVTTETGRVVYE